MSEAIGEEAKELEDFLVIIIIICYFMYELNARVHIKGSILNNTATLN